MREDGTVQNPSGSGSALPEPDAIGENATIERLEAVLEDYTRRSISTPEAVV